MAGNSLDLYDSYFYFDVLPHFHGPGALATALYGAFGMSAISAVGLVNIVHMLLEAQEFYTDVFLGTHNVRGLFDTVNDMTAGVFGATLYVGVYALWKRNWKRTLLRAVIIVFFVTALFAMVFHREVAAHVRSLLLISEQFEQIPIKPLSAMTVAASHEVIEFESPQRIVAADVFIPRQRFTTDEKIQQQLKSKQKKPALIIAMGVKTLDENMPQVMSFAETLGRLGFVVLLPQPPADAKRESFFEDPQTFVAAFKYLESQEFIDTERISFLGISVGSSVAMVASRDEAIASDVHGLVWFGGYADAFAYFVSLATKTQVVDGGVTSWEVADFPRELGKNILVFADAIELSRIFEAASRQEAERIILEAPFEEKEIIEAVNPASKLSAYQAKTFILHEKSDTYVPYSESVKLKSALAQEQIGAYHIANLFDHVRPKNGFSGEVTGEFVKLYRFVYTCLRFL